MAQEFTESTPLETLYEEAYQAELAVWNDRHRAWGLFFSPGGPYSIGVACDVFLVWFPLAVIVAAELNALFREPIFLRCHFSRSRLDSPLRTSESAIPKTPGWAPSVGGRTGNS